LAVGQRHICEAPERRDLPGVPPPPVYGKARMDLVMRDHRATFDAYAFQDNEITLAYDLMIERFGRDELRLGYARHSPERLAETASVAARAWDLTLPVPDDGAAG
jgi:hypothetical protein